MSMVKFDPSKKSISKVFNFDFEQIIARIQKMEPFKIKPEPKDDGVPR